MSNIYIPSNNIGYKKSEVISAVTNAPNKTLISIVIPRTIKFSKYVAMLSDLLSIFF